MSSISKDRGGDALLIAAITLMGVGTALMISHTYEMSGAALGTAGGLFGMIAGLTKRDALDSGPSGGD
jgi:hypothetical protein